MHVDHSGSLQGQTRFPSPPLLAKSSKRYDANLDLGTSGRQCDNYKPPPIVFPNGLAPRLSPTDHTQSAKSSEDRILVACGMLQKPTRLSKRELATLYYSHICVPHVVLGHFKSSLKTLQDFADFLHFRYSFILVHPNKSKTILCDQPTIESYYSSPRSDQVVCDSHPLLTSLRACPWKVLQTSETIQNV